MKLVTVSTVVPRTMMCTYTVLLCFELARVKLEAPTSHLAFTCLRQAGHVVCIVTRLLLHVQAAPECGTEVKHEYSFDVQISYLALVPYMCMEDVRRFASNVGTSRFHAQSTSELDANYGNRV